MDTWGVPGLLAELGPHTGRPSKGAHSGCGFKDEWVSVGEEGWEDMEGEGIGQAGGKLWEGEWQGESR